jgi:RNA polymerase sigma-70 factor (ECF subfamily)
MTQPSDDGSDLRARFEEAALPHLDRVYAVALRLVRSPDDASDLAQETYLRAYRGFRRFRPGTNCKGWLITILYSIFINRYWKRKREAQQVPVEALDEGFHQALADGSWLGEEGRRSDGERADCGSEVAKALDELPTAFRAAVVLVDIEGLCYEDAAAALQCPLGTLRSRLFRGRRLLFVALRDYAQRAGYLKPSREYAR